MGADFAIPERARWQLAAGLCRQPLYQLAAPLYVLRARLCCCSCDWRLRRIEQLEPELWGLVQRFGSLSRWIERWRFYYSVFPFRMTRVLPSRFHQGEAATATD